MEAGAEFDPLSLGLESILAEARERTGFEDFGDDAFLRP